MQLPPAIPAARGGGVRGGGGGARLLPHAVCGQMRRLRGRAGHAPAGLSTAPLLRGGGVCLAVLSFSASSAMSNEKIVSPSARTVSSRTPICFHPLFQS
jgi:hypothetical protein